MISNLITIEYKHTYERKLIVMSMKETNTCIVKCSYVNYATSYTCLIRQRKLVTVKLVNSFLKNIVKSRTKEGSTVSGLFWPVL